MNLYESIKSNNLKESSKQPAYVICYGQLEIWPDVESAKRFYTQGMDACEGAESERYMNIVYSLGHGNFYADDFGTEMVTSIVDRNPDGSIKTERVNCGRMNHEQAIDYILKLQNSGLHESEDGDYSIEEIENDKMYQNLKKQIIYNIFEMYEENLSNAEVYGIDNTEYAEEVLNQNLYEELYDAFGGTPVRDKIDFFKRKILEAYNENDVDGVEKELLRVWATYLYSKSNKINESEEIEKAKILNTEETGGGNLAFVGEIGDYNFVGSDVGVVFFPKELGVTNWEKYEEDAYNLDSTYGEYIEEYIPEVLNALRSYAETVKNPAYKNVYLSYADEIEKEAGKSK